MPGPVGSRTLLSVIARRPEAERNAARAALLTRPRSLLTPRPTTYTPPCRKGDREAARRSLSPLLTYQGPGFINISCLSGPCKRRLGLWRRHGHSNLLIGRKGATHIKDMWKRARWPCCRHDDYDVMCLSLTATLGLWATSSPHSLPSQQNRERGLREALLLT